MLAPGKCPDEPGGRAIGLASGRSGPVPDPLEDLRGSRRSTCAPLAQAPASHGSVGVLSALARTGQPASHARHGPRFSRAVPREAPGALRGHPR